MQLESKGISETLLLLSCNVAMYMEYNGILTMLAYLDINPKVYLIQYQSNDQGESRYPKGAYDQTSLHSSNKITNVKLSTKRNLK